MSAAGERDDAESIGETRSKVVVDVAGFTEASQQHYCGSAATPINDFKSDILPRWTRNGNKSDMACRGIGPPSPLGVGSTPCCQELWSLFAEGEIGAGAGSFRFSHGGRRGAATTRREGRDREP